VPLKCFEPEIPESVRKHDHQPAFVVVRHAGDRHEVNVDAVLPVERTALAGERNTTERLSSLRTDEWDTAELSVSSRGPEKPERWAQLVGPAHRPSIFW
jgi:hypothetical protein